MSKDKPTGEKKSPLLLLPLLLLEDSGGEKVYWDFLLRFWEGRKGGCSAGTRVDVEGVGKANLYGLAEFIAQPLNTL